MGETEDLSEEAIDEGGSPEPEPAPGRLALTAGELRLLARELPDFEDVEELLDLLSARRPDGELVIGDELYALIERIAGEDVYLFRRVANCGLRQALKEHGY